MAVVGSQRITFAGASAVVRVGYRRAAVLGPWRIQDGWLAAAVVTADDFLLTQSPLTLELVWPTGEPTRRAIDSATVHQGQFSARLVPKG